MASRGESKFAKVKKAQTSDGLEGAIGGNFWRVQDVLKNQRLPPNEIVKFIYLAEGPNLTTDIAFARDEVPLHLHRNHDELIHVLEGSGTFRVRKSFYKFGPQSIIYIPEDTVHGGKLDGEIKILSVYTPKFDIRRPDRVFVDEDGRPIAI